MSYTDYVVKAAEALDAPGEIWLFRDKIFYDPASREWCFIGSPLKGLKFIGETRYWVLKICGWLQFKYPEGPICSICQPSPSEDKLSFAKEGKGPWILP